MKNSKKILFVTYGGGHAHMVYPILNSLKETSQYKNGDISFEVLGLTTAKKILETRGYSSLGFSDFIRSSDKEALELGKEFSKEHHSEKSGIPLEETVAYLGLNLQELIQEHGKERAMAIFSKKGRGAFFPLQVMERVFSKVQPNLVVTTNSPRAEAAAIHLAQKKNIPNILMTDLFSLIEGYKLEAKNITFLNEIASEMLLKESLYNPLVSKAHITGNPAFDKLLDEVADTDREWLEGEFSHIGKNRQVVLHADMPAYWDPEKRCSHVKTSEEIITELDVVYKAAKANGAYYLIRPHPSQSDELYKAWLEDKEDAALASRQDLHTLLRNVSLLVVRTSTVGLEACYLGLKVLQLDSNFHSDLPLVQMGVAWGSPTYDEVRDVMRVALEDGESLLKVRDSLKKNLPNEPASKKIVELILSELF